MLVLGSSAVHGTSRLAESNNQMGHLQIWLVRACAKCQEGKKSGKQGLSGCHCNKHSVSSHWSEPCLRQTVSLVQVEHSSLSPLMIVFCPCAYNINSAISFLFSKQTCLALPTTITLVTSHCSLSQTKVIPVPSLKGN